METSWMRQAKKYLHSCQGKHDFKSVRSQMTGDIQTWGRVDEPIVSYEEKEQLILPYEHRISLLITSHMPMYGHNGVLTVMAKARKFDPLLQGQKEWRIQSVFHPFHTLDNKVHHETCTQSTGYGNPGVTNR